ncbi:E-selectin-like, partial [Clinocottus analis]|uniref:E-selectin-like n=1 Tax=Clinocottus analis TaxID=304258 RepID=UPI0035BF70EF
MFQEPVDTRQSLCHMLLIVTFIVFVQDLSSGGGAQAWTYNYSTAPNRGWLEARKWCLQHFTDMVPIRNQAENDYMNNMLPLNRGYYWIGVGKKGEEWVWEETNEKVPKEAQNWASEEPDNIAAQDCVEIYIKREKDTAKWNNERCQKKKGTICYSASCTKDSCSANADCVETIGNYTCRCHPGFVGSRCEEAIACTPLLDPERGSHYCFHPRGTNRFNSSCSFHCELGFQLAGVPQLQCQASGRWSHPVPLCQVKKCSPTFFPVTGNVTCVDALEPFSFGSRCKFTCQEGYYLTREDTFTCLASGQWSNPSPACAVVQCSSLKAPPHAAMQCQDPFGEYSYGSICALQCEQGFDLIGSNVTKCSPQGNWSLALPVCQPKRCNPINPPHGSPTCSDPNGSFSFGSVCTTACDEGFLPNGTASAECTSLGMWSADLPHCLAMRCPAVSAPSHGSLGCADPHGEFSFGSRCTSACEEGFLLNGTADTECTSLGTWSAHIPRCLAKRCPAVSSPSHGSLRCSDPHEEFSFGSRCTSTCMEGFLLNGTAETECTSLGEWSAVIPHCLAKRCPTLSSPSHGSLGCADPHGEFSFGSRCTSACEEGFLLNGTADTECTSLGTWSAHIPRCLAKRCPAVSSPSHGSLRCSAPHGEFSFGSQCRSTCEEGFVLEGTADTECSSSGMWSREIPHCLAQPCPLLAKAPQHGRMNCSHPYAPFSYDSRCDFECNEGFWRRGTPTMTCDDSGHWSQDLPTCRPVQCEAIRALSLSLSMNCSHPLGNFSFSSRCLFSCEEGFSLNGTELLFCSSSGLWNDSRPNCT